MRQRFLAIIAIPVASLTAGLWFAHHPPVMFDALEIRLIAVSMAVVAFVAGMVAYGISDFERGVHRGMYEAERNWRLRRGLCLKCGYNLRGTPDRCPECGTPAEHAIPR
jgi:hypothetical protein